MMKTIYIDFRPVEIPDSLHNLIRDAIVNATPSEFGQYVDHGNGSYSIDGYEIAF